MSEFLGRKAQKEEYVEESVRGSFVDRRGWNRIVVRICQKHPRRNQYLLLFLPGQFSDSGPCHPPRIYSISQSFVFELTQVEEARREMHFLQIVRYS